MKLALLVLALVLSPAPAFAEEYAVPDCHSYGEMMACAYTGTSVGADLDPVEESQSCAYGPAVEVGGPEVSSDRFGIDAGAEGYDSGPLWMIPC